MYNCAQVMEADDMQELKVRFYKLMVEYDMHEKDPFSLCSDYHSIYTTPSVKADAAQWQAALKACVLYLVLSPYSNTQQDMLHRVVSNKLHIHHSTLPYEV
jgi:26S proteasome regulatory subunit N5